MEYPKDLVRGKSPVEGRLMISLTGCVLPYDFLSVDSCCSFIEDKCYNTVASLTFIKRDKEQLYLRCPLSGEFMNVYASEPDLDAVDDYLILHNLYRHGTHP